MSHYQSQYPYECFSLHSIVDLALSKLGRPILKILIIKPDLTFPKLPYPITLISSKSSSSAFSQSEERQ